MTPFKVKKIVQAYYSTLITNQIEEKQVKDLKVKGNTLSIETQEGKFYKNAVKYE